MTLALSPEIQKLIDDRVRSGRYASVEDVISAAICQMDQNERLAELSPEALETIYPDFKRKLDEGLAAADAGRVVDGEALFDELDREEEPSRDPHAR